MNNSIDHVENTTMSQPQGRLQGRVGAAHDWLLDYAKRNAERAYLTHPLDDDIRSLCVILGWEDILAVKMARDEQSEDEQ